MIKLFDHSATEFDTLGLGALSDATKCEVTEERNGLYELEMDYPIKGKHYSDIAFRSIIYAKSNPTSDEQPFRVYQISKPINGIVTFNAQHISYDLSGCVVSPFETQGLGNAMNGLKTYSVPTHRFNFRSDKESGNQEFNVQVPTSVRSLLGGVRGSLLDIFGTGEYEFDKYDVIFNVHRGIDRGVHIRYGKNLTDLRQDENCANVYTAVYPFWAGTVYTQESSSDVVVTLDEKLVQVEGNFPYSKILPLDLSDKFQNEQPTKDQLREAAAQYIKDNGIGEPKISLEVSFVQLAQYKEYELLRDLERVSLCDTVTVEFPDMGVKSTAKCVKTVYNVLTGKYTKIELGDSKTSLVSKVAAQDEEIANMPTESEIAEAIKHQTKLITGGLGGYVILHNSTGQDHPDELLILEAASGGLISKAQKLWRWNFGGLGFSRNGYNGPYEDISITMDGKVHAHTVYAEGIKAGTIDAHLTINSPTINGGTLNLGGKIGNKTLNGELVMYDASGTEIGRWDVNGISVNKGSINLGSGKFSVTNDGVLTAKAGKVGGFDIHMETKIDGQNWNLLDGPNNKVRIGVRGDNNFGQIWINGDVVATNGAINTLQNEINSINNNVAKCVTTDTMTQAVQKIYESINTVNNRITSLHSS